MYITGVLVFYLPQEYVTLESLVDFGYPV